jgi:hypothetical protein
MKLTPEQWMRRVANLLGFHDMPPDVAAHAEYLLEQKASPEWAAEFLREALTPPPSPQKDIS